MKWTESGLWPSRPISFFDVAPPRDNFFKIFKVNAHSPWWGLPLGINPEAQFQIQPKWCTSIVSREVDWTWLYCTWRFETTCPRSILGTSHLYEVSNKRQPAISVFSFFLFGTVTVNLPCYWLEKYRNQKKIATSNKNRLIKSVPLATSVQNSLFEVAN